VPGLRLSELEELEDDDLGGLVLCSRLDRRDGVAIVDFDTKAAPIHPHSFSTAPHTQVWSVQNDFLKSHQTQKCQVPKWLSTQTIPARIREGAREVEQRKPNAAT
jgi:hypothetical protein